MMLVSSEMFLRYKYSFIFHTFPESGINNYAWLQLQQAYFSS